MASVARKDAKRFSSLNLGTTYKGAKPEPKGAGSKGGFQSLGKIQGKRMPGPAQLPSLRKENAGNDPNVNLVPQAGGGWGAGGKEDDQELSNPPSSSSSQQPVTQPQQEVQPSTQQSTSGRDTAGKKEGIWATPDSNSVGPANIPSNQHFKKNFPSLEEREARGTKRTISNDPHHDNTPVPSFNEMDHMNNVPPIPPSHYYPPRGARMPYPTAPSHVGPPYLPRGVPPFRHGIPPPPTAEYNHYGHHGGSYRGYHPQQQPAPPPSSAAGGQYQYPVGRYSALPNSSLPHNMDPYQDGQSKLVKSEELKNLELPDEDDDVGGWAGYHEEVDYSKKVVFEDSSEDEERESHQEHHSRQPKRSERESTRDIRMQEAPPITTMEQPHLHAEQSNKHLHGVPGDLQYYQQQQSHSGSHYPLYYNHPQRGYPLAVASRPVDKEKPHPPPLQSDLWQQTRRAPKAVPPPETAWGEDKVAVNSTVQVIANEQMDSIQQQLENTTLNDNDCSVSAVSAEKKHVTFHLEQQQQPAAPPTTRQPLKIMMRDMKVATRDEHDQPPATAEIFHHSNMGKPPYHQRPNDHTDSQHATPVNSDKSLPQQQQQRVSAWNAADRGPITTPRTLYEPEGDKSAKKFNALIKQTSSERAKRSSVSDTTQDDQLHSPSGDIKILKAEEKQSRGKHQLTATEDTTSTANKPPTTSGKSKNTETSSTVTRKGSKRERPSVRQYQPPPAREQDEQAYSEGKGTGRRPSRQDYNYEQQQTGGSGRGQRRRDQQYSDSKHQQFDRRHSSSESKHQQAEGKSQSEGKHHSEGRRQHVEGGGRRETRSRKEETSKEPPSVSGNEQTEQLPATAVKEETIKHSVHSQDDKNKQSSKESHGKGGNTSGETKQRKKSGTASTATQKSDSTTSKEKSRSRGSRNRSSNTDDWYYSEEYYNQWYAAGGYDSYYYDYYGDGYNYYSDRRAPSGRQKQQQQSYDGKNTSERRDNGGKKYQQQQQSDRGSNRPARTRGGGDKKDETFDDKTQQHRTTTKDKSRGEVSGEEVPRPKPSAEEIDSRDNRDRRKKDIKQYQQEGNVDRKRSNRITSSKITTQQSSTSTSKSSASHDPAGRSQVRNKTTGSQERPQQSEDQQHSSNSDTSSGKKEPAIKDKAASAKMANVDINSPTVVVIDEEQTIPLSPCSAEVDDFIRVTSKKEKREMKELEKHRQQEKQRKAEEEENKKKQHSSRKSSQKTNKQQQQQQLQERSITHEEQPLTSSWITTSSATPTVTNPSIWTETITNLLNEGVSQSTYMAAAHSSLVTPGDYQLFPTSYSSHHSVPLAHLSAAVDSSVPELPTSASQSHTLTDANIKPSGVGRQDNQPAGHGAIRTDLPVSKSHSSVSVSGAIGRGRGSSSSRAPGSNRGSSSTKESSSSKRFPPSSSDGKLSSSSSSPKISKPSSAVPRSKPSTPNSSLSSDKVTPSSVGTVMMTPMAVTAGKKTSTSEGSAARKPSATGGVNSKRAGGDQSVGGHNKSSKQRSSKQPLLTAQKQQQSMQQQQKPHPLPAPPISSNVNAISYANAVKASPPGLQDKKSLPTNKPVAYVKPTASLTSTASLNFTVDQQQPVEDTTASVDQQQTLSRVSFPTARLSQEMMMEEHQPVVMVSSVNDEQSKNASSGEPVIVLPPQPFVPPPPPPTSPSAPAPAVAAITKSSSPATVTAVTLSSNLSSFTPFTFGVTPSTIPQVTTVTSTIVAQQSTSEEVGKEAVGEVEVVASKRIRLGTTVQRDHDINHPTKLNIAAVPFIPSSVSTTNRQITTVTATPTTTTAAAAAVMAATPTGTTMPFHKGSMPAACYQLPTATMMHTPQNMVPVMVPHPQMGSGYAISQQTAYPSVFPSHTYPVGAHPPSIVGLQYPAYPIQQPTMVPRTALNSNTPAIPNYNMFVPPVTVSGVMPPAALVHHTLEQMKKEEQLKMLNDKRFFEQTPSVVKQTQQQPQLYKFPVTMPTLPVKQQLPVTTEGGRRTLLESPTIAMTAVMPHPPVGAIMSRPLELTPAGGAVSNPSTGSKRKRRPLLFQPVHTPVANIPSLPSNNNIAAYTVWEKPTSTQY